MDNLKRDGGNAYKFLAWYRIDDSMQEGNIYSPHMRAAWPHPDQIINATLFQSANQQLAGYSSQTPT